MVRRLETGWETPTIEVRAFRHGELLLRELCESEAEADRMVELWSELDDVTCQVDDLSYHHRPGGVLEPEPAGPVDPDYPPDPGGQVQKEEG